MTADMTEVKTGKNSCFYFFTFIEFSIIITLAIILGEKDKEHNRLKWELHQQQNQDQNPSETTTTPPPSAPKPEWQAVTNAYDSRIPLVYSPHNKIPANHNYVRVYEDLGGDCDMYLSWPNTYGAHDHPGPSLKWSNLGKIEGMNCIDWYEPEDKQSTYWQDNVMCLPTSSMFEMKFVSDGNPGDGWELEKDCIYVNMPNQNSDEGWVDNFFCVKSNWGPIRNADDSEIPLVWSSEEKIPDSYSSIRIHESQADEYDMFLSWPSDINSANHPGPSFVWSNTGNYTDTMDCVAWYEPGDQDKVNSEDTYNVWYDNVLCLPENSGYQTKFLTSPSGIGGWNLERDCVHVNIPFQHPDEYWYDNYFCVRKIPTCVTKPGYPDPTSEFGSGWTLVRHKSNDRMSFQAKDNLAGTEVYGTADDNPNGGGAWSIKYDHLAYDQFLFATWDYQIFAIIWSSSLSEAMSSDGLKAVSYIKTNNNPSDHTQNGVYYTSGHSFAPYITANLYESCGPFVCKVGDAIMNDAQKWSHCPFSNGTDGYQNNRLEVVYAEAEDHAATEYEPAYDTRYGHYHKEDMQTWFDQYYEKRGFAWPVGGGMNVFIRHSDNIYCEP